MRLVENIPFFSIFIMMAGGIVTPLLGGRNRARVLHLVLVGAVAVMSGLLLGYTSDGTCFRFMMGHFPAPWGNEVRAGALEALMSLVFSLVMFLTVAANKRSLEHDIPSERAGLYYVMMNLLFSSLLALIYTNDLFTAYVFIEINTISACAIVCAKESGETVAAAIRYLIMSLVGSGLILISIALLYCQTGHLLMEPMAGAVRELALSGKDLFPLKMALVMMTSGLAVKSALYPFSSWLPGAHANATAASSSVLSGLVLKGYIILLLKVYMRIMGMDLIIRLRVNDLLFVFGILAMVIGSVKALQQHMVKRVIAYSSIAQIGYIFMGIGMGTMAGLAAAVLHMIVHAVTKPMLFTAAGGLMDCSGHQREIAALRGSARRNPAAGIGLVVGSMAMIGIPFFSGFISKISFAMASFHDLNRAVVVLGALAVSTVLNAMYYIPLIIIVFSERGPEKADYEAAGLVDAAVPEVGEPVRDFHFAAAMACFMAGNVLIGTCYGPVVRMIETGLANFG